MARTGQGIGRNGRSDGRRALMESPCDEPNPPQPSRRSDRKPQRRGPLRAVHLARREAGDGGAPAGVAGRRKRLGARDRRRDRPQPLSLSGRRRAARPRRARLPRWPAASTSTAPRAVLDVGSRRAPAEYLPFDDESFDTVVSTLVLCTVSDPRRRAGGGGAGASARRALPLHRARARRGRATGAPCRGVSSGPGLPSPTAASAIARLWRRSKLRCESSRSSEAAGGGCRRSSSRWSGAALRSRAEQFLDRPGEVLTADGQAVLGVGGAARRRACARPRRPSRVGRVAPRGSSARPPGATGGTR